MPKTVKDPDEFLRVARDRWARSEASEDNIRKAAARDLRFLTGNQWPEGEPEARRNAQRPALTINKLPPFVSQVTNEQRKNRPGAKVSPQGEGADKVTAEIYQGLIRHIEYSSQADVAYDTAFDYAVSSGFGYWRYTTEYVSDRSTNQEIRVARIKDASTVRMDSDCEEVDCSDAMWAFVWRTVSTEAFKRLYPESETAQTNFAPAGGFSAPSWLQGDNCIVAEYWQVEPETKKLWMYRGIPQPAEDDEAGAAPAAAPLNAPPLQNMQAGGPAASMPGAPPNPAAAGGPGMAPGAAPAPPQPGMIPPALAAIARAALAPDADEQGRVTRGFYDDEDVPEGFEPDLDEDGEHIGREVEVRRVWRYDVNGHEILGKPKEWAGKYIPIVPVWGQEKYVEGERHLFSAIRFALDPQQLYNYYKTAEAEVIQMTPKNPFIGVLGQFKTMQLQWSEMNTVPRPFVEYDPVVVGGTPAPPPQRQQYEPATQALTLGAAAANEDIKATTGLFDASRGKENPSADSGVAIGLLQQQGETSTWHFFDNFLRSMWHGYRILLDLIPKIYDAPRVVRIVRPDDAEELIHINRLFTGPDGKQTRYDLSQGDYAVAVGVQPSHATQRQQAAADLGQLARASPESLPLWSDLFVKQLDIGPIGDQIADRLTPAQFRTDTNVQQLQQSAAALAAQNKQLVDQVNQLTQTLATESYQTQAKNEQNARDNAAKIHIAQMQEETKRMNAANQLAMAEINTKTQTAARIFSDMLARMEAHEAMAHEVATGAQDRALAAVMGDNGQPAPPAIAGGPAQPGIPPGAQPGAPGAQPARPPRSRIPTDQDLMALVGAPANGAPPPQPGGGQ
ncbi:MAG TPA: portal protein [Casimicrobiaceae bacterium]|nr:portal protein [Casimicrobiaceae bacterium]